MQAVDSTLQQMRSDTAIAVETSAHAGQALGWLSVAAAVVEPSVAVVGNPALFSVGGGNPDDRGLFAVSDLESPLGVEMGDVPVSDRDLSDGVDNIELFGPKYELWSEPQQVGDACNYSTYRNVENKIRVSTRINEGLGEVDSVQNEGGNSPSQVSLRSEHFNILHTSIIAGEDK